MRYQLRTFGWVDNRPYNRLVGESDHITTLRRFLTNNTYIIDTLTGDIIEGDIAAKRA